MGSSIVLGGLSTILGTIPLAFSSSQIFHAVLTIFMSFVILSLVYGLLFLPILLVMCGPISNNSTEDATLEIEGGDGRELEVIEETQRDRKNTAQSSELNTK